MAIDFDSMTPKEVRKWGNELAYDASQLGEVRATLIVNCEEGRTLAELGLTYDESHSVVSNLMHILTRLVDMVNA